MGKSESVFNAAKLVALVIIVSKIVGFLRDVIIAKYYGAGTVSDAYFYAYQIPALSVLILGGVGGPFHSAIVSVFAKLIPADAKKAPAFAVKLFNTFLTVSFLVFLILGVLIFLFAKPIMSVIISGGSSQLITLAAQHLKIMSPAFVVGGVIGIYYGILVTFKNFLLPNLSPVIMSLTIIIGVMLGMNDVNGYLLAGLTTLGAIIQMLVQMPKVHSLGFKIKPNLKIFNNEELKSLNELLFPAILSSTVGQIYVYADMFFTSQLQEGAWSAIGYANRIFQFPVGILVTAFLVPLFPLFSRLVAEKNYDNIRYYFNKGIGMLNFMAFLILTGILLLAYDGVFLVFQRGQFDTNATIMVSTALIYLSFGIIPYVFRDCITRIYYAFGDSKTPFIIAVSSILIKVILNMILIKPFGIGGITLSTALVTLINASWLGFLVKKKINLNLSSYFKSSLKMLLASIWTFGVCFIIYKFWVINDVTWILVAFKTFVMAILCCIIYIISSLILKVEYVKGALTRIYETVKK